jgi:phospholipid/cholesterol/gamma-HCH transport system ATP-binding protein
LARAIALDPPILFLDEPSAGLDPVTSAELDRTILNINKALGTTIILITHELQSIMSIATRALMLDKLEKKIIADGTPVELSCSNDERVRGFFTRTAE